MKLPKLSVLLPLLLPLLQQREPVHRLRVPWTGELAGTAIGRDGHPLAGTWLIAVSESTAVRDVPSVHFSNNLGRMFRLYRRLPWHAPRAAWSWPGSAWTDSEGRFAIDGLKAGAYRIFVQAEVCHARATELTEEPVATGAKSLCIRPHDQQLVVALSASGDPVYPARPASFSPNRVPWVDVSCVRSDSSGAPLPGAPYERPIEIGFGRAVFSVQSGAHYVCAVDGEAIPATRVWIQPGIPRTRTRLMVDGEVDVGGLLVRVLDPDGRPYVGDNQVAVFADGEPEPIARSWRLHGGPAFRAAVGAGAYRVRVTARDGVPMCGTGWYPELARFGPVETNCVVERAQETLVEVRLVRGGRIRLTLEAVGEAVDPDELACNGVHDLLRSGTAGAAARVTLIPIGSGRAIPVEFTVPACRSTYRQFVVLPGVPTVAHTIAPAGSYVLQARSGPYEWEPVVVDIHDDEVTHVVVPLP